ncbi:MAG TPA: hypothetical protein VH114_13120 [Candidatus Acidoferrum sp.]|nr:hypothetical protein [Candidatus Acidoferrum sp.]
MVIKIDGVVLIPLAVSIACFVEGLIVLVFAALHLYSPGLALDLFRECAVGSSASGLVTALFYRRRWRPRAKGMAPRSMIG